MDKKYLQKLKLIVDRYEQISEELLSPEVMVNIKKYSSLNKEISSVKKVVEIYKKYVSANDQLQEAKLILIFVNIFYPYFLTV